MRFEKGPQTLPDAWKETHISQSDQKIKRFLKKTLFFEKQPLEF